MADQTALIQALQKRIQLLEDKQELAELLDAYCKTIDLHDFAGHANTYTVDGTQQYGPWGPLKGRQVIEKQVRQAEKDVPILQHSMTNMKFEIAGEGDRRTATGTSFLIMVLSLKHLFPFSDDLSDRIHAWTAGGPNDAIFKAVSQTYFSLLSVIMILQTECTC